MDSPLRGVLYFIYTIMNIIIKIETGNAAMQTDQEVLAVCIQWIINFFERKEDIKLYDINGNAVGTIKEA